MAPEGGHPCSSPLWPSPGCTWLTMLGLNHWLACSHMTPKILTISALRESMQGTAKRASCILFSKGMSTSALYLALSVVLAMAAAGATSLPPGGGHSTTKAPSSLHRSRSFGTESQSSISPLRSVKSTVLPMLPAAAADSGLTGFVCAMICKTVTTHFDPNLRKWLQLTLFGWIFLTKDLTNADRLQTCQDDNGKGTRQAKSQTKGCAENSCGWGAVICWVYSNYLHYKYDSSPCFRVVKEF